MPHDVIEDTEITWDDLKREGFSINILSVLDPLLNEQMHPMKHLYNAQQLKPHWPQN